MDLTELNYGFMAMPRTTKIIGFSVPPALAKEVEEIAKLQQRSKSELFREMFRVWKLYEKQRLREEQGWITGIIQEGQHGKRVDPGVDGKLSLAVIQRVSCGERQGDRLDINETDIGSQGRHPRLKVIIDKN